MDEIAALVLKEVTVVILSQFGFNGALSSSIEARPLERLILPSWTTYTAH